MRSLIPLGEIRRPLSSPACETRGNSIQTRPSCYGADGPLGQQLDELADCLNERLPVRILSAHFDFAPLELLFV